MSNLELGKIFYQIKEIKILFQDWGNASLSDIELEDIDYIMKFLCHLKENVKTFK